MYCFYWFWKNLLFLQWHLNKKKYYLYILLFFFWIFPPHSMFTPQYIFKKLIPFHYFVDIKNKHSLMRILKAMFWVKQFLICNSWITNKNLVHLHWTSKGKCSAKLSFELHKKLLWSKLGGCLTDTVLNYFQFFTILLPHMYLQQKEIYYWN